VDGGSDLQRAHPCIEWKAQIPGHGTSSHHWPQAYAAEKFYLETLLNETREAIAKGKFLEDVVETIGKNEKQKWLLHEQHHRRNVTKAFTELEWE